MSVRNGENMNARIATMIPLLLSTVFSVYANQVNAGQVNGQALLEKGTQEFNIQGLIDFNADDKYSVDLNAKYGYFVKDGWEIGANVTTDLSRSYKSGGVCSGQLNPDTWLGLISAFAGGIPSLC